MNELVIIGQNMDHDYIRLELESCLCTDEEIAEWIIGAEFVDPWPTW